MRFRTAGLIVGLLLFIVFSMMIYFVSSITELVESESKDLLNSGESVRIAQQIRWQLLAHNRNAFLFHLQKSPEYREAKGNQQIAIRKLVEDIEDYVSGDEEKALFEKVESNVDAYIKKRNEIENQSISPTEKYLLASQFLDDAMVKVDQLISINKKQMRELAKEIDQQNRRVRNLVSVLSAIGLIVGLGLFYFLSRYLLGPVSKLSRMVQSYRKGEFLEHVDINGFSEFKNLGNAFNSMALELEARRKDQLGFISSVAHDLRNPLNSISMAADVIADDSDEGEKGLAEIISRQTRRLDGLVGDLLDTTRIEAGRMVLKKRRSNIVECVADSVELYRSASSKHQIHFAKPDEPVYCEFDESRLSQVFNNLISNAIKYSPDGGNIEIRVLNESHDFVKITFADNGIGIGAAELESVFRPFNRSKNSKDAIPGIGLGLSSSRKLVEAHRGTLTVNSQIGKGSVFEVTLPFSYRIELNQFEAKGSSQSSFL
ncbi:MAG: HAMP domain-containing protein [Bdellovibrionales bacterium]|nr:HAMP domain-containing protein [Bdellovibrionales bacterium]